MERMLRHAGRLVPERRRALELNPKHPVVERLIALHGEDPAAPRVAEFAELLLAQAHVAEGSAPPDPKRFAELVNRLLLGS
jgi:molecular chaperone HtpG